MDLRGGVPALVSPASGGATAGSGARAGVLPSELLVEARARARDAAWRRAASVSRGRAGLLELVHVFWTRATCLDVQYSCTLVIDTAPGS